MRLIKFNALTDGYQKIDIVDLISEIKSVSSPINLFFQNVDHLTAEAQGILYEYLKDSLDKIYGLTVTFKDKNRVLPVLLEICEKRVNKIRFNDTLKMKNLNLLFDPSEKIYETISDVRRDYPYIVFPGDKLAVPVLPEPVMIDVEICNYNPVEINLDQVVIFQLREFCKKDPRCENIKESDVFYKFVRI